MQWNPQGAFRKKGVLGWIIGKDLLARDSNPRYIVRRRSSHKYCITAKGATTADARSPGSAVGLLVEPPCPSKFQPEGADTHARHARHARNTHSPRGCHMVTGIGGTDARIRGRPASQQA
jgi:hypothetical protein